MQEFFCTTLYVLALIRTKKLAAFNVVHVPKLIRTGSDNDAMVVATISSTFVAAAAASKITLPFVKFGVGGFIGRKWMEGRERPRCAKSRKISETNCALSRARVKSCSEKRDALLVHDKTTLQNAAYCLRECASCDLSLPQNVK